MAAAGTSRQSGERPSAVQVDDATKHSSRTRLHLRTALTENSHICCGDILDRYGSVRSLNYGTVPNYDDLSDIDRYASIHPPHPSEACNEHCYSCAVDRQSDLDRYGSLSGGSLPRDTPSGAERGNTETATTRVSNIEEIPAQQDKEPQFNIISTTLKDDLGRAWTVVTFEPIHRQPSLSSILASPGESEVPTYTNLDRMNHMSSLGNVNTSLTAFLPAPSDVTSSGCPAPARTEHSLKNTGAEYYTAHQDGSEEHDSQKPALPLASSAATSDLSSTSFDLSYSTSSSIFQSKPFDSVLPGAELLTTEPLSYHIGNHEGYNDVTSENTCQIAGTLDFPTEVRKSLFTTHSLGKETTTAFQDVQCPALISIPFTEQVFATSNIQNIKCDDDEISSDLVPIVLYDATKNDSKDTSPRRAFMQGVPHDVHFEIPKTRPIRKCFSLSTVDLPDMNAAHLTQVQGPNSQGFAQPPTKWRAISDPEAAPQRKSLLKKNLSVNADGAVPLHQMPIMRSRLPSKREPAKQSTDYECLAVVCVALNVLMICAFVAIVMSYVVYSPENATIS